MIEWGYQKENKMNARFQAKDTSELYTAMAAYLANGGSITDCNTVRAKNSAQLGRSKVLYKSGSLKCSMKARVG